MVAFNLFQKYYTNEGEVPEPHCDSMFKVGGSCECHVTIMWPGAHQVCSFAFEVFLLPLEPWTEVWRRHWWVKLCYYYLVFKGRLITALPRFPLPVCCRLQSSMCEWVCGVSCCPCLLPCSWCDSLCCWGRPGGSEVDFWHDILLFCHCHPPGHHRRWLGDMHHTN